MKVALVVSGFPDGLKHLENNRNKVKKILKKYGWEVESFDFSSIESLKDNIDKMKEKKIKEFIFFYTGHGDTSNEDGILTLKFCDETVIDLNSLYRDYITKLEFTKLSIILDACYSGNFNGQKIRDNMEYLCSSDFDQQSFECDTLRHSYFSYYFCEALENLNGEITLDKIKDYLQEKIAKQSSKYFSFNSKMVIANKPLFEKYEDILNSQETKKIKELLAKADLEFLQKIAYTYMPINRIGTLPNNTNGIIDELLNIGKFDNGSIPALCFFNHLHEDKPHNIIAAYINYLKEYWYISTIACSKNEFSEDCSLLIDIDIKDGQNDKYEISVWKYANGKVESQESIGGILDIKDFLYQAFALSEKLKRIYENIYFEIILPDELLTQKLCEWSDSRGIKLIQKSKYLQRFQSRFRQPSQELVNKCSKLLSVVDCDIVSKKDSSNRYNYDITDAHLLYYCDKTIDNFNELKEHIKAFGTPIMILPTIDSCIFESTLLENNPHDLKDKLCAYRMANISNSNSKFLFIYDDVEKIPEHYKNPQNNLYGW